MRIGIDGSRAARTIKTGTEWYSYRIIEHMMRIKNAHNFLLYTNTHLPFALSSQWREKKIVWPLPYLWSQGGLSLEMMWHCPDVLFVPSHAIPLIHQKKTVTTIHDVGFLEWREYRSAKDLWYLDWSTRFAVKYARGLIVISEFTKQEVIKTYHADPKTIHVIHLGIDESYREAISDEKKQVVRKKYNLTRPFILFVGRIDSRKNISRLVEAFEILKSKKQFDGDLCIVGAPGFDGKKILDDISARNDDQIRCIGWADEGEKRALLQSAEVFVFPSLYEGFGLPVIEAQASGVPVVCSNTTSLPEIAGDGALLVDPLDIESIAGGIATLLTDEEKRSHYRQKGYENSQRFSWDRCARETLHVLEQ